MPLDYASPTRTPVAARPGSRLKFILYWFTGNFWLLVALAVYLGRTYERSGPTMYSVWGAGQWFTRAEYTWLVLVPAALGVGLTCLGIRHGRTVT